MLKKEFTKQTGIAGAVVAALASGQVGVAADLKAPFELETSMTLPKGVRNPRFKTLFMSVDTKYNAAGVAEPLGQKLNKAVTWEDLEKKQTDEAGKAQVRYMVNESGAGQVAGGPGSTTGVVNTFANVMVPVLGWGITDNLTLAAAVPIYNVDVQADTGFVRNDAGLAFQKKIEENDPVKAAEVRDKLVDPIQSKLQELGYQPIQDMQVKGVGDVKLVSKYRVYNDTANSFAVKADVTLPTGKEPNADRALDVPTGDGQTDVGATLIYDRMVVGNLRLNTFTGYTLQAPDSIEKRLPVSATDSLSADKELLSRNLGDQVNLGTSLNYEFEAIGLLVGAGYNFQYLTKTTYSGENAANEFRYRLLENEAPLQALHSATLAAGFSTVGFFKAKKFPLPFQANMAYSKPIVGRNVTKNDVIAGELVLFF